jgi:hypothetical protein
VLACFDGGDMSGDFVFVNVRIGFVVREAVEVVEIGTGGP